jgi:hypothetical protein
MNKFDIGTKVHFFNSAVEEALTTQIYEYDGVKVCDIPNVLLTVFDDISVYVYVEDNLGNRTTRRKIIMVRKREKPSDYIYTETELWTAEKAVKEALAAAKESGEFNGADGNDGKDGQSGVYVGEGEMPENCNVQIIPNGDPSLELSDATKKEIADLVTAELPESSSGGFVGELLWEAETDGETAWIGNSNIVFEDGIYFALVSAGTGNGKLFAADIGKSNGSEGIRVIKFATTTGTYTSNQAGTVFMIKNGLFVILSSYANGAAATNYGYLASARTISSVLKGVWFGKQPYTTDTPPAGFKFKLWRLF